MIEKLAIVSSNICICICINNASVSRVKQSIVQFNCTVNLALLSAEHVTDIAEQVVRQDFQ